MTKTYNVLITLHNGIERNILVDQETPVLALGIATAQLKEHEASNIREFSVKEYN